MPITIPVCHMANSGAPAPPPPTGATDTFNRTNADPVDSPMSDGSSTWESGPGAAGDVKIVSNQAVRSSGTWGIARVSSGSFDGNQYAEATLGTGGSLGACPAVRIQGTSDASCYVMRFINASIVRLYRLDDTGSIGETEIASVGSQSASAGDVLRIEADGTTIKGYIEGSEVLSVTDSNHSGGVPGIGLRTSGATIDAFDGGDL